MTLNSPSPSQFVLSQTCWTAPPTTRSVVNKSFKQSPSDPACLRLKPWGTGRAPSWLIPINFFCPSLIPAWPALIESLQQGRKHCLWDYSPPFRWSFLVGGAVYASVFPAGEGALFNNADAVLPECFWLIHASTYSIYYVARHACLRHKMQTMRVDKRIFESQQSCSRMIVSFLPAITVLIVYCFLCIILELYKKLISFHIQLQLQFARIWCFLSAVSMHCG